MKKIIAELTQIDGAVGVIITGRDGILIDGDIQTGYDSELISALVANIAREIEKKIGVKKDVLVSLETNERRMLFSYTKDFILCCISTKQANLGDIRVSLKNGMEKLMKIIGE